MPPELDVHGPRWARVTTHASAVAGLLSLVAAFWWGATIVALFALVLLGLTVARVGSLPGVLQAVTGPTILFAAWAATLGWYAALPLLDLPTHAVATGLLSVIILGFLRRLGVLPTTPSLSGTVLMTLALGALLGVLWELGEWAGHTWLDDAINVGYDDTMGDLLAGTLGSACAGVALSGVGRHEHD